MLNFLTVGEPYLRPIQPDQVKISHTFSWIFHFMAWTFHMSLFLGTLRYELMDSDSFNYLVENERPTRNTIKTYKLLMIGRDSVSSATSHSTNTSSGSTVTTFFKFLTKFFKFQNRIAKLTKNKMMFPHQRT
jgi:hypothetical protein